MSKRSLSYYHSAPIQIRFNDIDKLDHVTNSVYQQYFDLGRMAYFDNVLKERMDWSKEGLVLVNITINFLSPIRMFDSIEVRTKVTKLGNKSLEMQQEIFNLTTEEVAASSSSVMVGFNGTTEEAIPVPARWRERISSFEKDVLFEV